MARLRHAGSVGCGALVCAGLFALAGQSCVTSAPRPSARAVHAPPLRTRAFEDRFIRVDYDLMLLRDGDAAGTSDGTWSSDEQRRVTVLATHGDTVSNLKVSYADREDGPLLGVFDSSPTDGHTYFISRQPSGLSIRRADGSLLSPAERQVVATEYGDVGEPQPLLVLLAGHRPGEQLVLSARAARALLGAPPDMEVDGASVHARLVGFRNSTRQFAVLAVTMHGQLSNGHTVFDLDVSGPARVDLRTGWLRSLHLKGRVKARGEFEHEQLWYNVSGTGTIVITRSAAFG